ncbi:putative aspartate aminotransferase, cytoplasmic 2 [Platysternon megacephalum]|uniref:Putative aspartate aminotransferase, cytoplasmic 2 n=1 Tax=Platysternon megacephalum TaxID=55544 RepID=A0A4D9EP64_9SAUR|nr:putative aspartate aminotransferase, cytoplasmic 2 [Platysternon megacephalum]
MVQDRQEYAKEACGFHAYMEFHFACALHIRNLAKITVWFAKSQRRVTFHLPDGSQESCSDSGLGDHEPSSSASTSHPLPLGFPQEEYYEQASPNSRTEGDGNSDPESNKLEKTGFI